MPKFILEKFRDDNGKLWMFDKRTDKSWPMSPQRALGENGFYKMEEFSRDPLVVERWLSDLESAAAPPINKIINEACINISREERLHICRLFAAQLARSPKTRAMMDLMSTALAERGVDVSGPPSKVVSVGTLIDSVQYVPYLMSRTPVLYKSSSPHGYSISDSGCFMDNQFHSHDSLRGFGLGTPGTEFHMPISRELCLTLLDDLLIDEVNRCNQLMHMAPPPSFQSLHLLNNEPAQRVFTQLHEAMQYGTPIEGGHQDQLYRRSLVLQGTVRFVCAGSDNFAMEKEILSENPDMRSSPGGAVVR